MSENMYIFDQVRNTPNEARKPIKGGRLNGFTDINPMWRIKRLTELFGPCGIGWKYEILNTQLVPGAENEVAAFVDILLYYKRNGEWSEGIPGFGGSMFVAKEKGGLHTSDECYKMALTDAIGTACKALGMSADIFFEKDRTKYNSQPQEEAPENTPDQKIHCMRCGLAIQGVQFKNGDRRTVEDILKISRERFGMDLCWRCLKNGGDNGAG